jgi:hypothetical protein
MTPKKKQTMSQARMIAMPTIISDIIMGSPFIATLEKWTI